jgi:hypothetical protein
MTGRHGQWVQYAGHPQNEGKAEATMKMSIPYTSPCMACTAKSQIPHWLIEPSANRPEEKQFDQAGRAFRATFFAPPSGIQ